jgi:hypothetical protein
MARTRLIKPALFENEVLGQMDGDTVLLFTGLWCIADRDGRLEDRPLRIKAQLFPYREMDVAGKLALLSDAGFIMRYEVDGVKCIQVNNWQKHQRPHVKENPSDLPPPNRGGTNPALPRECSAQPRLLQERPSPLTLNPSPLTLPPSPRVVEEVVVKVGRDWAAEFEEFWKAYPDHRKDNRYRTQSTWSAVRLLLPPLEEVLGALAAFKSSKKWKDDQGKYVPSPHSWLEEHRWQDAPAYSAPKVKPKPEVDEEDAFAWRKSVYPESLEVHPTATTFPFRAWPDSIKSEYRNRNRKLQAA